MDRAAGTPPPLRPEPTSGRRLLRRTTPFQFLNSDAFAIFFLIVSLCFIFTVLISPFYSFSSHIFKPQSTRKSLDFLSLALVFFAIACGLMSKNNGENRVHEEIYKAKTTSNDSEESHKSNPSAQNQWHGYADRTDQILLHYPPEVATVEYWRVSGRVYTTDYQSPSSDSVQHCRNLEDFEEDLDVKRGARATFSVYDAEMSSSSSALHQFSVPPLMTSLQLSSPPVRIPPPSAVVEAEVERINEGDESFEPPLLRLDFQALEDEISKNEKQRDTEMKESKRKKKKNNKSKTKQWQKGVENFNEFLATQHHHWNSSPPPAPPPPVAVHHYQTSGKIGETRKDFPAPPQSPPKKLIAVRTQNGTGGKPTSTAAELQIVTKGEYIVTRNENAEKKGAMFCGSPDVNSKADSFIERFRAGLKLETMNSIKEGQRQRKTRTSILGRKGPEQ